MDKAPAAAGDVLLQPWQARFYRDGDDASMLQVLTAAFGGWPGVATDVAPIDHLRWKLRSHGLALPHHVVVESDGQLVGTRLAFVQEVKVRERLLLSRQGTDVCVRPEYRGRGILRMMQRFSFDRFRSVFDLNLGSSGNPAVNRLDEQVGFRPVANRIERLVVRVTDAQCARRSAGSIQLRAMAKFDEGIDGFWRAAAEPFDLIVARTSKYLNWRYCDERGGRFMPVLAEESGEVVGYSVVRVAASRGYVADMLALPGRLDVVEMLLGWALEVARGADVETVECWLPSHHPYRRVFGAAGFARRRRVPLFYLALRAPAAGLALLDDSRAAVHFTMGDCDRV